MHVNPAKSGKLLEGVFASHSEAALFGGKIRNAAAETISVTDNARLEKFILPTRNEKLRFEEAPFAIGTTTRFKPVFPSQENLMEGGFTLPRGVKFRSAPRKPPNIIITDDLPRIDDPAYDRIVANRFNVRLDLADENSIGIMHPRFRNSAKQLTMLKSLDRNLSLYGNNESGGVGNESGENRSSPGIIRKICFV